MKQLLYLLCVSCLLMAGCSDDDKMSDPDIITDGMGPDEAPAFTLDFTTETEEDQIGEFADNAIVEYDGFVWVAGGHIGFGPPYFTITSEVWKSSNGANWQSVSSNQFPERRGHSLSVIDNRLFLIGGDSTTGSYSDIWSSTDGLSWTLEVPSAPFGTVNDHTVTAFNGRWYLIYGSAVWSTANGVSWTQETAMAFPPRNYHKTLVFNNALYVLGGFDASLNELNEIWRSTDGMNWTQITPTGDIFSPRVGHTVTMFDGKVFVIGGRNGGTVYREIYYSEDMIDWKLYPLDPDPDGSDRDLYAHGSLNYAGSLWIFGGYDGLQASSEIISIDVR